MRKRPIDLRDSGDFYAAQTPLARSGRLPGRLFCRSRNRRGGDDAEDRRLVCDPGQADLEPSQLDFRPGLVNALFLHGCCSLACLAARRS